MKAGAIRGGSYRATLAAGHDAITHVGFVAAAACLVIITGSYCYEVVARYFFSAPTEWASSMVSYALCGMVFMAMPELSRQRIHIVINMMLDRLPPEKAEGLRRILSLVVGAMCLIAAWFCADTTIGQYQQGIQTLTAWPIAKWPVSSFIVYGMLSTSIYFLRHAAGERLVPVDIAAATVS
jgi:TRAP-type C4-dicarboxylate transport system permease small subunit